MPDHKEITPHIYTIGAGAPFVDDLADGLMARYSRPGDPLDFTRVHILVPTRRAVTSLSEAFVRLAATQGKGALLLPRISPIGDVDEDALIMGESLNQEIGETDMYFAAPEAIDPLQRHFILSRLILEWSRKEHEQGRTIGTTEPTQALRLAAELGQFLDNIDTHNIDASALQTLVPDTYTEYWQETLRFLHVVTHEWPEILHAYGMIDQVTRRNLLLCKLARHWQDVPPAHAIVAAGSTGSVPATAELLSVIARLPEGAVVLPGLDLDLDAAAWQTIDPTHPQAGMKDLLESMGVGRDDVRPWPGAGTEQSFGSHAARRARRRLINEALRPAGATEGWRRTIQEFKTQHWDEGLKGLSCIEAAHPGEEALVIALILRETLEQSGKTAALVTPDRTLARRVAALMQRWDVETDDSAGHPLGQTPVGHYLRLVADFLRGEFEPLSLLSLLKHPLASCGMAHGPFLQAVETLELFALRGPRPSGGLTGVRHSIDRQKKAISAIPGEDRLSDIYRVLDVLDQALGPFLERGAKSTLPFTDLVTAHVKAAEELARGPGGAHTVWSGTAGEAAAGFISGLLDAGRDAPALHAHAYPGLFDVLVMERAVRPRYGVHPRLSIWGPLEARLQQADTIVLGGLNEGTWPVQAHADPWLNRPMRTALALPLPERRIGLAAHDFAQLSSAGRVIMTRSQKVDGAPTVPSRWLLRLKTILNGAGADDGLTSPIPYLAWARALDQPARIAPCPPPEPRPPVSARPRRLSVTEIETWIRDPYALYAKRVLNLAPLDAIDDNPGRAERGLFIHKILDRFVREHKGVLTPDALRDLIGLGREIFAGAIHYPGVRAIWWPRFERIAGWFITFEQEHRKHSSPLASEVKGETILPGPAGDVTLIARADRIDQQAEGLSIIDYKTGTAPSKKEVKTQLSPQLPLEGLIAGRGGFAGVAVAPVTAFSYIELKGGATPGEVKPIASGADAREMIETAGAGLTGLIARFDQPDTPYRSVVSPKFLSRYRPYDHLARVKEWLTGDVEAAGGGS